MRRSPYVFEYSNVQLRVRWPELHRLELEPALRILGDSNERFLEGVMERSTSGILFQEAGCHQRHRRRHEPATAERR